MRIWSFVCIWLCAAAAWGFSADKKERRFSLLYAGSWTFDQDKKEGTLENRIDGRFFLPWQELNLRAELLSKNGLPPVERLSAEHLLWGAGLYHGKTGSRFLYGSLDEQGLSARVRNPWIRSAPFVDKHAPSSGDFIQSFSASKKPKAHLFLSTPRFNVLNGASLFASGTLSDVKNPLSDTATGAGGEIRFSRTVRVRAEWFWHRQKLPAHSVSSWFSQEPPLPARASDMHAASFLLTSPWLSLSSDWAFSRTVAFGRGVYGNIGVRIGKKPLLLSLAVDGMGDRFIGNDRDAMVQGARLAVKLEHYGKRNALFRISTMIRSRGLGDLFEGGGWTSSTFANSVFERGEANVYYRFPSNTDARFSLSRLSFSASRNADLIKKIKDSYRVELGMHLWRARVSLSGSLKGFSSADTLRVPPYPIPKNWCFDSARVAGSTTYRAGMFQFGLSLGHTAEKNGGRQDGSLSVRVSGKRWRVTGKIACEDFPKEWLYTISLFLKL